MNISNDKRLGEYIQRVDERNKGLNKSYIYLKLLRNPLSKIYHPFSIIKDKILKYLSLQTTGDRVIYFSQSIIN